MLIKKEKATILKPSPSVVANGVATLYSLQLLRFLAALLVLLFHLLILGDGYKGVDVFFVISGFVMYYTLYFRTRPTAIIFILNRVAKIFFLYWVALLVLYWVLPFGFRVSLLQSLLLVPGHPSLLGVSWSLSYELYFYFLMAVVVYLLPQWLHRRIFFLLLITATCVTIINLTSFTLKGSFVNFLFGGNFWEFLLGIGSAFLSIRYGNHLPKTAAIAIGLLSLLSLLLLYIPYASPLSYVVYGPLSLLVIFFFTALERQRPVTGWLAATFRMLGDASYAIYLFGPIVTIWLLDVHRSSKFIVILSTVFVGIVFNRFLENPLLQKSRRYFTKKLPQKDL